MSIGKNSAGNWYVEYREGSRKRHRVIGRRADAKAIDEEIRRAKRLGTLATLFPAADTLADLHTSWAKRPLARNTRDSYRNVWRKHLSELAAVPVAELDYERITRHVHTLRERGVGEPTIFRALAILSGILKVAQRQGKIIHNPVSLVEKPAQRRSRIIRPIPVEGIEAIAAGLSAPDRILVYLIGYAGLRPGEALALTWADVGDGLVVDKALAHGEVKDTKTSKGRVVTLHPPALIAELEGRRLDTIAGPVVGGLWSDQDYRSWRRYRFEPAAYDAGLEGTTPYYLRHSFASLLIHEGHPIPRVAEQMGDRQETVLAHYSHVFEGFDPARRVSAEERIQRARAA